MCGKGSKADGVKKTSAIPHNKGVSYYYSQQEKAIMCGHLGYKQAQHQREIIWQGDCDITLKELHNTICRHDKRVQWTAWSQKIIEEPASGQNNPCCNSQKWHLGTNGANWKKKQSRICISFSQLTFLWYSSTGNVILGRCHCTTHLTTHDCSFATTLLLISPFLHESGMKRLKHDTLANREVQQEQI